MKNQNISKVNAALLAETALEASKDYISYLRFFAGLSDEENERADVLHRAFVNSCNKEGEMALIASVAAAAAYVSFLEVFGKMNDISIERAKPIKDKFKSSIEDFGMYAFFSLNERLEAKDARVTKMKGLN